VTANGLRARIREVTHCRFASCASARPPRSSFSARRIEQDRRNHGQPVCERSAQLAIYRRAGVRSARAGGPWAVPDTSDLRTAAIDPADRILLLTAHPCPLRLRFVGVRPFERHVAGPTLFVERVPRSWPVKGLAGSAHVAEDRRGKPGGTWNRPVSVDLARPGRDLDRYLDVVLRETRAVKAGMESAPPSHRWGCRGGQVELFATIGPQRTHVRLRSRMRIIRAC